MTELETILQPLVEATGLDFLPVGRIQLDGCDKTFIEGPRPHDKEFSQYPDDNIAVTYLDNSKSGDSARDRNSNSDHKLLVIDIDGSFSHSDDKAIYLEDGTELPLTLYSTTSCSKKAHLYYLLSPTQSQQIPTRAIGVIDPKIDAIQYGTIFEGHGGKDNYKLYPHPLAYLPDSHPFMAILKAHRTKHPSPYHSSNLYPISKPAVAAAVRELIEILTVNKGLIKDDMKHNNQLLRRVIPKKYIAKGSKDIIKNIDFSYSFVNDTAAKLSAVAELSTEETRHFIELMIQYLFHKDPNYQNKLDKEIFATIHHREAIKTFSYNDMPTLEDIKANQPGAPLLILKSVVKNIKGEGTLTYIALDPVSYKPYTFAKARYFNEQTIASIAEWRTIYGEDGQPKGWDKNVPLVESHISPYHPHIDTNEENDVLRINLYPFTPYQEQATPIEYDIYNSDNILFKFFRSAVRKEYLPYLFRWYTHVMFADRPPLTIVWYASGKAGAGKSAITSEILNRLIGPAVAGVDYKGASSGWADVIKDKRLLAIEDVPHLPNKEWQTLYGFAKRQGDGSHRILNNKGSSVDTDRVRVSISGSSNYYPKLDPDDRRFFCLEPAHLEEESPNDPLTPEEITEFNSLLADAMFNYREELQELMDHLYHIYQQPLTTEEFNELYVRAPMTVYKAKWRTKASSYSERIVYLLFNDPDGLLALVKERTSTMTPAGALPLDMLIEYIITQYRPNTGKAGISWKWFLHFMKYIKDEDIEYSKQSLEDSLQVEFSPNKGILYKETPEFNEIAVNSGITDSISADTIERYRELLAEMRQANPAIGDGIELN